MSLVEQEANLARASFSTSYDLRGIRPDIFVPEDVSGLRILDIGGGASTIALELAKEGAQTVAIDFRYADTGDLKRSVDRTNTGTKHLRHNQKVIDAQLKVAKKLGSPHFKRIVNSSVKESDQVLKEAMKRFRKNRDTFFDSIGNGQTDYVASLAGHLPFKDGTFDMCIAASSISVFSINDPEVFHQTVDEAFRVLKPGGILEIIPWVSEGLLWDEQDYKTAESVEVKLREMNAEHYVAHGRSKLGTFLLAIKPD